MERIVNTLSATTLRTALVDYRAELLRMLNKYPSTFAANDVAIDEIDRVLLSIEGNITTVNVTPSTCNPNR
jgi:hypothetical protein